MKFLRDVKGKITKSKWFGRLKSIKNVEIVIAAVLALVAIVAYVALSLSGKDEKHDPLRIEMTETEARVARMISEIAGVGEARVLITNGPDKAVVGVVIVAEGADSMGNRVKMIRLAEKATGATVDQIEIFEMAKGG